MERPYDFIPSALVKEDLRIGKGRRAHTGDNVVVHFIAWLAEGRRQFDSTRGRPPLEFTLGESRIILGLDQGIVGMREGGRRKITVPAALGYGAAGRGDFIPPHAKLVYELELLAVR